MRVAPQKGLASSTPGLFGLSAGRIYISRGSIDGIPTHPAFPLKNYWHLAEVILDWIIEESARNFSMIVAQSANE
jgi:hypothetical protein